RRRHTRSKRDWNSDVCSSDLTGKSTFIKKFMESVVLPNIEDESERARAHDELPQSAAGKTIMTTEPKFIPNQAVSVNVEEGLDRSEERRVGKSSKCRVEKAHS